MLSAVCRSYFSSFVLILKIYAPAKEADNRHKNYSVSQDWIYYYEFYVSEHESMLKKIKLTRFIM